VRLVELEVLDLVRALDAGEAFPKDLHGHERIADDQDLH
jgi:hypothetical protein